MTIYVLNWIHRYLENEVVVRDTKFMGTYSSEENAKKAIEMYQEGNEAYIPYCDDDVQEWGEFEIEMSNVDTIYDNRAMQVA